MERSDYFDRTLGKSQIQYTLHYVVCGASIRCPLYSARIKGAVSDSAGGPWCTCLQLFSKVFAKVLKCVIFFVNVKLKA